MNDNSLCEAEPQIEPLSTVEDAKAFLIAEGSRLCVAAVKGKARAIVLTGSMSRGEATFEREGTGWRVLGDVTFLVVLDRFARPYPTQVARTIEQSLLANAIRCKTAVVQSTASALRKMKPHIYAYELRERGVVLWGDPSVLRLMPRFTPADIPCEDGWWLLCNRIIEQLETSANVDCDQDQSADVRYRVAKLYLAMAACYLLSIGQYQPSYQQRTEVLRGLANSDCPPRSPVPLTRFSRFVSDCTDLKLHGYGSIEARRFPKWCDAVSDAEAIWRWTLGQLSGADPELDRAALLAAIAKRQHSIARTKGWIRAICVQRAEFRRSWRQWWQVARQASPRYLIYAAASELFFAPTARDTITPQELENMTAALPLRSPRECRELTWKAAAKMIAYNFHCLVESTRS